MLCFVNSDHTFTWDKVRQLSSVSDTDLQVDYTYDDAGIRTSKTVNGVTTHYNTKDGVILAQSDGSNTLYFQYDTSGSPFAFVWNDTQYYYVTNQMGDVIGITDDSGNLLVQYHYDAWGKLLSATLTDANNATQKQLAQLNPLLYRGYYYDFETGYYYLQSRYYDPNLCRFINSDVLEMSNVTKDTNVGTNMFAYCGNDPVNNDDAQGKVISSIIIKAAAKMLLGVLAQYVGDIIDNICRGKTGRSVFKPTSSVGSYVSAAITALIPGNKLINSVARACVSTAITSIEKVIKSKKKQSLKTIIKNIVKTAAFDVCCTFISSAFAARLNSLKPKNYSQFAHSRYLKNSKMTPAQIKKQMKRLVKSIGVANNVFNFFANSVTNAVSKRFEQRVFV